MDDKIKESLINALYEQAETEVSTHRYDRAIDTIDKLMGFVEEGNNYVGRINLLLAKIYKYRGQFESAKASAIEALGFYEETNDMKQIAICRELLGDIYYQFCKYQQAIEEWNIVLEVVSPMKMEEEWKFKGEMHVKLGKLLITLSQYDKGRWHYIKGFACAQSIDDKYLMGRCQMGIGITYHLENHLKKALRFYNRALKLVGKSGNKILLGRILHSIGDVYTKLGNLDKAKIKYKKSLEISEKTGDFLTSAATLREMGRLHLKLSDEKTTFYCEKSLNKLIENVSAENQGECERLMGKIFYLLALYNFQNDKNTIALKNLVEAGEIFKKFNMKKEKKRAEILYATITGEAVKSGPAPKTKESLLSKLGIVN